MKRTLTTLLTGSLLLIACRKERTCSCTYSGAVISVTTPRNGSGSYSQTSTISGSNEQTVSKVKKDDMVRLMDCNNKTEASTVTYTTALPTGTTFVVADVNNTYTIVYDCKIK